MTFLAKDARRAIINRCATNLSARFAGRAFAVPAFVNDVSPRTNLSPSLGCVGAGEAGTNAVSPTLVSLNLHEVQ